MLELYIMTIATISLLFTLLVSFYFIYYIIEFFKKNIK